MRFLIADDNEECRQLIHNALRPCYGEAEFVMAEDGAHAWWLLTETTAKFDLCIVDISMPKVDGFSLLGRIRAHAPLEKTQVLMCSALSDRNNVTKAATLHVNGYIAKPFGIAALRERVASLLVPAPAAASK